MIKSFDLCRWDSYRWSRSKFEALQIELRTMGVSHLSSRLLGEGSNDTLPFWTSTEPRWDFCRFVEIFSWLNEKVRSKCERTIHERKRRVRCKESPPFFASIAKRNKWMKLVKPRLLTFYPRAFRSTSVIWFCFVISASDHIGSDGNPCLPRREERLGAEERR